MQAERVEIENKEVVDDDADKIPREAMLETLCVYFTKARLRLSVYVCMFETLCVCLRSMCICETWDIFELYVCMRNLAHICLNSCGMCTLSYICVLCIFVYYVL